MDIWHMPLAFSSVDLNGHVCTRMFNELVPGREHDILTCVLGSHHIDLMF